MIDNAVHDKQEGDSSEEKRVMDETINDRVNLKDQATEVNVAAQPDVKENPIQDGTSTVSGTSEAKYQTVAPELTQQVNALKTALEERSSQYMRIAADFENFRKRTAKEKEDLEQQVKSATIIELLPIVDNFERARAQLRPETDAEVNIHRSYQSVYRQMVDALKRLGVSAMRPEGMEFDPNLHEAVMRQPTNEHPEGTVLEELVRGYFLGDRILRHAMVKVAAPGSGEEPGPGEDENPPSLET